MEGRDEVVEGKTQAGRGDSWVPAWLHPGCSVTLSRTPPRQAGRAHLHTEDEDMALLGGFRGGFIIADRMSGQNALWRAPYTQELGWRAQTGPCLGGPGDSHDSQKRATCIVGL